MSSSDEETWEQVPTLTQNSPNATDFDKNALESLKQSEAIDIVVQTKPQKKQRSGITKYDRLRQLAVHHFHLLCLLKHGLFKTRWCDDEEVRAKAFSLVPVEFHNLPKTKDGIVKLVTWWRSEISVCPDASGCIFETRKATPDCFVQVKNKNLTCLILDRE